MMLLREDNQARGSIRTFSGGRGLQKKVWANSTWHMFLTMLMKALSTLTV
jgi:hypothetical protein